MDRSPSGESIDPIAKLRLLESCLAVEKNSQRDEPPPDVPDEQLEAWKESLFRHARTWCRRWAVDLLTENETRIDELDGMIEGLLREERQDMEEAIHDEISSPLFGLSLWLRGIIEGSRSSRGDYEVGELEKLYEHVTDLKNSARRLSHGLQENGPPRNDVSTALKTVIRQAEAPGTVSISLSMPQDPPDLAPDAVHHLKLIAQEALYNALRHAEADEIQVRVREIYDALRLTVTDDGTGFSPAREQGHGIAHMRHRSHLIGGELTIESGHAGTKVTCRCPLPEK